MTQPPKEVPPKNTPPLKNQPSVNVLGDEEKPVAATKEKPPVYAKGNVSANKKDVAIFPEKSVRVPTIGRIVNFQVSGEEVCPAIVMGVKNKTLLTISLNVFMPRGYVNFVEKASYSEEKNGNSWHWPEIVKDEFTAWPPKD